MKRDDIRKMRDKEPAELKKDLSAAREELRVLKFDLSAGKVKNVGTITETKRKIARILTFLAEKFEKSKNG